MKKVIMTLALVLGLGSVAVAQDAPKAKQAKTEKKACCKKGGKQDAKACDKTAKAEKKACCKAGNAEKKACCKKGDKK